MKNSLNTLEEIYAYKKQLLDQKKALENSDAFTEHEKANCNECFDYQIGICDAKLTGHKTK